MPEKIPYFEKLLRGIKVPERPDGYWKDFPKDVIVRLQNEPSTTNRQPPVPYPCCLRLWRGLGMATACLILGIGIDLLIGHRQEPTTNPSELQLAECEKVYWEMAGLFPRQIRGIVMDRTGIHLVLAENAHVPASPPLLVKVSRGDRTQKFITFSGQKISLNGEPCEVMTDNRGYVILLGANWVWSSHGPQSRRYQIEACSLKAAL